MRARPFKQSSASAHPEPVMNEYVREALEKQAARRPPKTPPRELSVTPTLPRVPKPHRNKRPRSK